MMKKVNEREKRNGKEEIDCRKKGARREKLIR